MSIIEKILDKKTLDNPEGRRYFKQWEIAKDYMPEFLQLVSHIFPHYSLHDVSHSETILNNIIKIVGLDVIERFSVVDLWLLLTSAYYHDCGMVVSGDDIRECLEDESDFIKFIKQNQDDEKSLMHKYATAFDIVEGKMFYKHDEVTVDNVNAFKFLLADYIRSHHAQRSNSSIQHTDSLHLPGNVIPERIIKILGNICRSHTIRRDEVLLLPQVESSGCGIEDCHPRYVACLLRIGDLLDVDTNRVSAVLLSSVPCIPADSARFNQTNRDITHIRIDRSVIEMTAQCSDYSVAKLVNNWFKMIDEEISFQSRYWYKIVPSVDYGNLPSVGDMVVKLTGYEDISGTNESRFQIDSSKAIEMLQGAGLYRDSSQSVRELLQNAVDATYLRIFLENPEINNLDEFEKECQKRPISVSLNKKRVEGNDSIWEMVIKDSGVGLERSELTYLSCTGTSSCNKKKKDIIEKMPSWMRPSGTFGIGFQSIFLITNKVIVKTQKYGKEESLTLELYNPSGSEKGTILVKSSIGSPVNCGTEICFEMNLSSKTGWQVNEGNSIAIAEINTYDFAKDESFDYQAGKLCDEIVKFYRTSYVPIRLNYKENIINLESTYHSNDGYYDEETGLLISLEGKVRAGLYFRNQNVEKFRLNLPLLNFCINILDGDAKDILTINRNDVQGSAVEMLRNKMLKTSCRYLMKCIDSKETEKKGALLEISAYLFWNENYIRENINKDYVFNEGWKDIKIRLIDDNTVTIADLLKVKSVKCDDTCMSFVSEDGVEKKVKNHQNSIDYFNFLKYVLHTEFKWFSYSKDGVVATKVKVGELIEDDEKTYEKWWKDYLHSNYAYSRQVMPCLGKYIKLAVRNHPYEFTFSGYGIDYPKMICPYIRQVNGKSSLFFIKDELKYDVDERVIDYVYRNRADEIVTKEDIKESYKRFEQDFSSIVAEVNANKK